MIKNLLSLHALTLLAVTCLCPSQTGAHGDVHESIMRMSQEIENQPDLPALRMERAGLFSQHGEFEKALKDLAKVSALEPGNDFARALRGEIFRRTGKLAEAREEQEAFLKKHPQHAQVRWEYCRTLADTGDAAPALRELDALIGAAEHPSPDAVALRLKLTEAIGKEEALRWLNGFLEKHPLPVFQEHALRLESAVGRTVEAVKRLDLMISSAARKETLFLRKAAILHDVGDKAGAAAAALSAQECMVKLPTHLRGTPATTALMQQVEKILSSSK